MDKPLVLLHGVIKTPPFSHDARHTAGALLRQVQQGEKLSLPQSRPMPSIGPRCHELRIGDRERAWRIIYRTDPDAILVVDVFAKKTRATPASVTEACKSRLAHYDRMKAGETHD